MEGFAGFGKCHQYINVSNGSQCKCFSFRSTQNNDYLCGCCGHDQNYHEPLPPREFDLGNFGFDDVVDEIINHQNHPRISRKNNDFKIINLSEVEEQNPKIPRGIKKLEKAGTMKIVRITNDSSNGIKSTIEASFPSLKDRNWQFFRCKSTSELRLADLPENIEELKEISGCRKKVYVGIPIQMTFQHQQNQTEATNFQLQIYDQMPIPNISNISNIPSISYLLGGFSHRTE